MMKTKSPQSKIYTWKEISKISQDIQQENKTVVFTNGCFDILHKGHVDYLYKTSLLSDFFILGLNTDNSVKRQGKADDRPINKEDDRAFLLAALGFIDAIVLFDEDTPYNIINAIQPNVITKGGDYDPEETDKTNKKYIVGSDIVKAKGGKVEMIEFVAGYSTTSLINKIRK